MGRSFLVETKYTAKDLTTSKLNRMNKGVGRLTANLTDGSNILNRGLVGANRSINRGIMVGLGGLGVGLGFAAKQFVDLDNSVRGAGAKFKDLDTTSADYQKSLDALEAKSREVASTTEFMATDTAGALDKMAMAGMTSEIAMGLLAGTTNLATAAGTDLTTAVDIATDTMGAFGLKANTVAEAEKNLARVSDVMAKTTTTANTSLEDMFDAVRKGAPSFTAAGQKMETFAAFTGVLANAGVKGGEAGTALRNVMLRLSKPTGEAAKVIKKLGVRTSDSKGNFRDAIDILADFEKGLVGMGTQQRTAALATIFGAKTVTGINLLLGEGSKKLRTYRKDIDDSALASNKMAAAMRGSLLNQLKVLGSTLSEKGFQIVEVFEKQGGGAIKKLTQWVRDFDVSPIVDLLNVGISLLKFVFSNWKIILAFAAAIKTTSIALGVLNIATALFGLTLGATPVGWAIGSLAALSAVIVLLATNWDTVTASMEKAWGWMQKFGGNTKAGMLIRAISAIASAATNDDAAPVSPLRRPQQQQQNFNQQIGANATELPFQGGPLGGLLDINFNNKPNDVSVKERNLPQGINVGIKPTESL